MKDRYGNRGWYRMSIEDLAKATGFEPAYDTFYREACTITHAGALPLLTPRYGVGCRDIETTNETADGRDYGSMALVYAVHMIFSMFEWTILGTTSVTIRTYRSFGRVANAEAGSSRPREAVGGMP